MSSLTRSVLLGMFVLLGMTGCSQVDALPMVASETAPRVNEVSYELGAGDRLRIAVFGQEALAGLFSITPVGDIAFPLIGTVAAKGRTIEQVQKEIRDRLADGYVRDPRVSVEIDQYRPFYVLGEVNTPGQYPFAAGITLQQAIATAGSYTYRANLRKIFVKRRSDEIERYVTIDQAASMPVFPGDTIRLVERYF